jgi:hypothetical protein
LIPVPANVLPPAHAEDILLDTSAFNGILLVTDNTVQKAMDRIDDHKHDDDYIGSLNGSATELTIINDAIDHSPLIINAIEDTTAFLQS